MAILVGTILILFKAFLNVECSHLSVQGYTSMMINEIACTAEKLRSNGGRYTCNHEGDVHCSEGWADEVPHDDTNRCAIPKCDAECKHGMCTSPNFCACEVGWDGTGCDICIPMPGCVNGGCKSEEINGILVEVAQTCDCHKFSDEHSLTSAVAKFEGPKCDRPVCKPACENGGWCVAAGDTRSNATGDDIGKCACPMGFKHDERDDAQQCSKCMKAAGCQHGDCQRVNPNDSSSRKIPGTCVCDVGYSGPLCDQLQCRNAADDAIIDCGEHGVCLEGLLPNGKNGCACEAGWQGEKCDHCVPYWDCPNKNVVDPSDPNGIACKEPNQCWCKQGGDAITGDKSEMCNIEDINGPGAINPNA